MSASQPLLAVTPGEPAGIGPEILLQVHRYHPEFRLVAVADPDLLRRAAERAGLARYAGERFGVDMPPDEVAKIKERKKARRIYERAKRRGRRASRARRTWRPTRTG